MSRRPRTGNDARRYDELEAGVGAARTRDPAAVGQLVTAASKFVFRRALVQARDTADAEDVTQEVMIKMLRQLDSLPDDGARIAAWLHRVTRNAAVDRFRRRSPLDRASDGPLADMPAPAATEPAQAAERAEMTDFLLGLLRRLPSRQREVFDLVELQGMAIMDVASELRIRASSVRGSLLKARRRLRREMLTVWPEEGSEQ